MPSTRGHSLADPDFEPLPAQLDRVARAAAKGVAQRKMQATQRHHDAVRKAVQAAIGVAGVSVVGLPPTVKSGTSTRG